MRTRAEDLAELPFPAHDPGSAAVAAPQDLTVLLRDIGSPFGPDTGPRCDEPIDRLAAEDLGGNSIVAGFKGLPIARVDRYSAQPNNHRIVSDIEKYEAQIIRRQAVLELDDSVLCLSRIQRAEQRDCCHREAELHHRSVYHGSSPSQVTGVHRRVALVGKCDSEYGTAIACR